MRGAPFGGDHGVVPEMPPEVIRQILRAAVLFPLALQRQQRVEFDFPRLDF
jgi:hypothetical protein